MMSADKTPSCPECEDGPVAEPILGRRDFIRVSARPPRPSPSPG